MIQSRNRVAMMVYLGISGDTVYSRSDGTDHATNDSNDSGWTIRISEIVLMAEYTTDHGPSAHDYFLVFVTLEKAELFYSSVTMSASGTDAVLGELEKRLSCSLDLNLASSTGWASRVVWPPQLAGSAYLEVEEVPPPQNLGEHLMRKFKPLRPAYRVSPRLIQILSESPHSS
jgi:hypothetical protein